MSLSVYPRECGGTAARMRMESIMSGLSPRVRGNLLHSTHIRHVGRSIPASAGEPVGCNTWACRDWVYPRECGGTRLLPINGFWSEGLSPRVRGNPDVVIPRPIAVRSIPASAGEPLLLSLRSYRSTVYPRECGGTLRGVVISVGTKGLSPRVRGNQRSLRLQVQQ